MTVVEEGRLRVTFPSSWSVERYDQWAFFDRFKSACLGNKGIDVVALDSTGKGLWLIELKDYRVHRREKDQPL